MSTRLLVAGLAAVSLALAACSPSAGTGGSLGDGTWALTTYAVDGDGQPVPAGVAVDATFATADSTVSGSSGCNRYNGPFTQDGTKLTFGAVAGTLMACDDVRGDVEAAYLANLALVRSFTATDATLTMYGEGGVSLLVFEVARPGELGGVTWHATGIENGRGGVEPVVAGTDPTLIYDPAGTVTGHGGCNSFNGAAVVDGASIAIGPLASTKMACTDEAASAQESAFLAALAASATFEVRGAILELRDATGRLLVQFEAR